MCLYSPNCVERAIEDTMRLNKVEDIDIKVELIQALIPLGLRVIHDKLWKEVITPCR